MLKISETDYFARKNGILRDYLNLAHVSHPPTGVAEEDYEEGNT